jgi:hypothetical protein
MLEALVNEVYVRRESNYYGELLEEMERVPFYTRAQTAGPASILAPPASGIAAPPSGNGEGQSGSRLGVYEDDEDLYE